MSVVPHQKLVVPADGCLLIQWPNLGDGDTGQPYIHPVKSDRTLHVKGTFGTDSAYFEGSNDPSDTGQQWDTLADQVENDLVIGTADKKIRAVLENPYQVRPRVAGGDASASLTFTLIFVGR